MALTEIYVDPSIAGNSGTGTIGDPFGDLQYALDQSSHDATNGTRFNVKSGTAEVLTGLIDLTLYGTGTFLVGAPLVFQGYTVAANDGGVFTLDCSTSNEIFRSSTTDYVSWIDMRVENASTTVAIIQGDTGFMFFNVTFVSPTITATNGSILDLDGQEIINNCRFEDIICNATSNVLELRSDARLFYSFIEISASSSNSGSRFIDSGGTAIFVKGNVFVNRISAPTANVVNSNDSLNNFFDNIFYFKNGTTGIGLDLLNRVQAFNNIFYGLATGIVISSGTNAGAVYGGNLFYNCTTNIQENGVAWDLGQNRTAASDPFVDADNNDFTLVSAERSKSFPDLLGTGETNYADQGPVQHQDSGGGPTTEPSFAYIS